MRNFLLLILAFFCFSVYGLLANSSPIYTEIVNKEVQPQISSFPIFNFNEEYFNYFFLNANLRTKDLDCNQAILLEISELIQYHLVNDKFDLDKAVDKINIIENDFVVLNNKILDVSTQLDNQTMLWDLNCKDIVKINNAMQDVQSSLLVLNQAQKESINEAHLAITHAQDKFYSKLEESEKRFNDLVDINSYELTKKIEDKTLRLVEIIDKNTTILWSLYVFIALLMVVCTFAVCNFISKNRNWDDGSVLLAQILRATTEKNPLSSNKHEDHSFAIGVANEIARIELNLSKMETSTRGYKQLLASVNRLKNIFLSLGYEMVELTGKSYYDGLVTDATFEENDDLPMGTAIIKSVQKPQINYKGSMIQKSTIIVSHNSIH